MAGKDFVFKSNLRLQIHIEKSPATGVYNSRIEEVGKNKLLVAMPMRHGMPVTVTSGTEVYGKIFLDSHMYVFKSRFLNRQLRPIPLWALEKPEDVTKIQRRQYVRSDSRLPVIFKLLQENPDQPGTYIMSDQMSGLSRDISGGGLQLVVKAPVHEGVKMQVVIEIPDEGVVSAMGEVVRMNAVEPGRIYWLGIRFIMLSEVDREKMIRYIFKRQLELRRRNLT